MTGACIEDVNHEMYGGIYSQMVFGESYQEPALPPPKESDVPADAASGKTPLTLPAYSFSVLRFE